MKTIRGKVYSEDREDKIKGIRVALNGLKQEIDDLNDLRGGWTDFDVAVVCWLLAHDSEELKFWEEIGLPEKILPKSGKDGMF
jgi:hypothetical protein